MEGAYGADATGIATNRLLVFTAFSRLPFFFFFFYDHTCKKMDLVISRRRFFFDLSDSRSVEGIFVNLHPHHGYVLSFYVAVLCFKVPFAITAQLHTRQSAFFLRAAVISLQAQGVFSRSEGGLKQMHTLCFSASPRFTGSQKLLHSVERSFKWLPPGTQTHTASDPAPPISQPPRDPRWYQNPRSLQTQPLQSADLLGTLPGTQTHAAFRPSPSNLLTSWGPSLVPKPTQPSGPAPPISRPPGDSP